MGLKVWVKRFAASRTELFPLASEATHNRPLVASNARAKLHFIVLTRIPRGLLRRLSHHGRGHRCKCKGDGDCC